MSNYIKKVIQVVRLNTYSFKNMLEVLRTLIKTWGVLLFFFFFCIAIWLGSIHIFSAEVSMSINTEGVYLNLLPTKTPNLTTEQLLIQELKISGAHAIQLDFNDITLDPDQTIQIVSKEPSTLSPINTHDGMLIHLKKMYSGISNYRFVVFNKKLEILIPPQSKLIIGRDTIAVGGKLVPKPLEIDASKNGLELNFFIKEKQSFLTIPHQIAEIQNWELVSSPGIRKSCIQSGKITFLEKQDLITELYKGDDIEVKIKNCKIYSLELEDTGIAYYLSGIVTDLLKSFGTSFKSQLPTWYDKLSNMPSVRTLGALITFIFGLGIHENLKRKQ